MNAHAASLSPRVAPIPSVSASIHHPWRSRMAAALASGIVAGGLLWCALPTIARSAAERLPNAVAARVGRAAEQALDESRLSPSRLTPERQKQLRREFLQLKHPSGTFVMWRIEFRGGDKVGPNAFALPNATIVVTDALVESSRDDREILGILAHEMGHLSGRHALRSVLESSPAGLAAAIAGGDGTRLGAQAADTLLTYRYSAAMERDADDFACRMMRANAISPALPGHLLSRLEKREPRATEDGSVPDFFATHGSPDEIARRLGSCQDTLASLRI